MQSDNKQNACDICIIVSDLGAGGTQRVVMNLLQVWRHHYRMGIITFAESTSDFFRLPDNIKRFMIGGMRNSSNRGVGLIANMKRIFLLRRAIRRMDPNLVLSFICPTNILTILASIGLKIRVIISERNDPEQQSFGWIWDQLRRYCYRYADLVTANSRGALQNMQAYVPVCKLRWAPNPIVPIVNEDQVTFEHPTILAVGRLHRQKGYDILLHAFAYFIHEFPQWHLAILGDGPLKNELQRLAHQLEIDRFITWYGNVDNPFAFYKAASIFVLASRHEGVPNALLEAMYFKLPVIVTDASPGPLEYVDDQMSGLVVAKENPPALFQAMKTLAKDSVWRNKIAENAELKVKAYSLDRVMEVWRSVLTLENVNIYEKN